MTKNIFIYSFFLTCLSTQNLYAQDKKWSNKDSCFSFLEIYHKYWKLDSIGRNGFRQLMADHLLKECHFEGETWKSLVKYLGRPNSSFLLDGKQINRYRLNYENKSIIITITVIGGVRILPEKQG